MSYQVVSKEQLLQDLDALIGIPDNVDIQEQNEIEARFGYFRGREFVSEIPRKNFFRILDFFLNNENIFHYVSQVVSERTARHFQKQQQEIEIPHFPDMVTEATFVENGGGKYSTVIRESFIDLPGTFTPRYYSSKRKVGQVDFRDFFTRFAMAQEQNLGVLKQQGAQPPVKIGNQPQSLRVKHRWSFEVSNQIESHPLKNYVVDLTHVTGWYTT